MEMTKNPEKRVLLLALFLLSIVPAAAQAQLYGVSLNGYDDDNAGPSSLYSIDPGTGAGTLIGTDMGYAVNSIAVDPTSGLMYAATTTWSGDFNGLLLVDPATGTATEIGPFGNDRFGSPYWAVLALTFDSSGQLWGWHDPNNDDPVMIDKTTGVATEVGDACSGSCTARHVLAFDSSDVLHMVQGTSHYHINQATGWAEFQSSLSFDPGAGGAAFNFSTGNLWAPETRGSDQDSMIRVSDIDGDAYFDIDTDIEYLNGVTIGDAIGVSDVARFKVTKFFSDGSDFEVDVNLTCNTGLPLSQDFTIAGGDETGVTFVVTDYVPGDLNCEVTETGSPDGYDVVYNGGAGCSWTGIEGGFFSCMIINEAKPATFTAHVEWDVTNSGGDYVNDDTWVTIHCEDKILNDDAEWTGYDWILTGLRGDGGSLTALADTQDGPAYCSATQYVTASGVESSDDCYERAIAAGGHSSCTFHNVVFFEGIPTLSQYGLALLALLMLGVGMVGFRRFV